MGVLDRFRLDGMTALVTGASRGIGRAMARALAEAGADIVGVSATLAASGSDVEKDVTAAGSGVLHSSEGAEEGRRAGPRERKTRCPSPSSRWSTPPSTSRTRRPWPSGT